MRSWPLRCPAAAGWPASFPAGPRAGRRRGRSSATSAGRAATRRRSAVPRPGAAPGAARLAVEGQRRHQVGVVQRLQVLLPLCQHRVQAQRLFDVGLADIARPRNAVQALPGHAGQHRHQDQGHQHLDQGEAGLRARAPHDQYRASTVDSVNKGWASSSAMFASTRRKLGFGVGRARN